VEIARLLDGGDECVGAYRFGGDEFAIVLACGEARARAHVEALYRRMSASRFAHDAPATVSVGVAVFPFHAREVAAERADGALYWAKLNGKNRACFYSPAVAETINPHEVERRVVRQARLRAAENLIRVVDAKDEYTGAHSERVALLVEAIGRHLRLEEEHRAAWLAGRLHDSARSRSRPRSAETRQRPARERQLPIIRARSLRWHISGRSTSDPPPPRALTGLNLDGLTAEAIPFGSRVILVADAFDAITTERTYRPASTVDEAIGELRRQSGAQFDPAIVHALECHLDEVGLLASDLAEVVPLRRLVA
jgi:hypothetical protein